jgi:hypothetical protein
MPCTSFPIAQNVATTQLGVSQSAGLVALAAQLGMPIPAVPPAWVNAIVDTGCSVTCVTAQTAALAGLLVVGMVPIVTAAGPGVAYVYYGDLLLTYPIANNVMVSARFPNRFINQLQAGGANFDALLGMDMLTAGTLVLDGPNNTMTFCW